MEVWFIDGRYKHLFVAWTWLEDSVNCDTVTQQNDQYNQEETEEVFEQLSNQDDIRTTYWIGV